MEQEKKPLIQFLRSESKMWYNGKNVIISDMESFQKRLPEFWCTDKDILSFFTYYNDGSYYCERKRTVYDYKLQTSVVKTYEFLEPTLEQAKEFYDQLAVVYEEYRLEQLKEAKDQFTQEYVTQFDIVNSNIKSQRSLLLSKTDWTQLPDSPLDEETKSLWRKFRQTLRDMTETEEWMTGNLLKVDFPVDPETYLARYPNREVGYLETRDQFKNQVIAQLQFRFANFLQKLSMPSSFPAEDPSLYEKSYDELREHIDTVLKKINEDLEIKVAVRETSMGACADLGHNYMAGMTPENKEEVMEYIKLRDENSGSYKPLEEYENP